MIVLRYKQQIIRSIPEVMSDAESIQVAVDTLSRRNIQFIDVYVNGRYVGKAWREQETGAIRHAVQVEFEY